MAILNFLSEALIFFLGYLFLLAVLLILAGAVWHKRRVGKISGAAGGLLLLTVLTAYIFGPVSWRLWPALMQGYEYNPNEETPDPRLVLRQPELIIGRQLAALKGQTGPAPLREDTPLVDFRIETVYIDGWRNTWVTAFVNTTLIFADGAQEQQTLTLLARGGSYILAPFWGEVNRSAYAWYAPESSLGGLLQTAVPATPLRTDTPPATLEKTDSIDIASLGLDGINPQTSAAIASDLLSDGTLLLDAELREAEYSTGNLLLRYKNGQTDVLAKTRWAARGVFSPNGGTIIYTRSTPISLKLILQDSDDFEVMLSTIDWIGEYHWVSNDKIAYSIGDTIYLFNRRNDQTEALATLPTDKLWGPRYFRVSPDGKRIAYSDFDGRLWVKEINTDEQQAIGWNVTEISWGTGMSWRDDGKQLLFTTYNNVTLPDQNELWLWDTTSGKTSLLARTGPGFLETDQGHISLGKACWVNEGVVLVTAVTDSRVDNVHILAAKTDGSGLWDITPPDITIPFPELHCANGYLAANSSPSQINIYRIAN